MTKQASHWIAPEGSPQLGRFRRRKAMERGEFVPYFQPMIELRTGILSGYEVLARWNHPAAGLLLPEKFVHHAEIEGWVGDLMKCLLQRSFQCAENMNPKTILAINVSPLQFQDLTLPDQIASVAERWNFALDRLMIEITETAFLADRDRALLVARELKQIGCKLSLDDFGTGYSSLRTLQSLPFDEIKVDRSFVSSMQQHRDSRKIVAAVVGLGQSLGITTVAEGIENQEQADMLLWLGCDLGQGWLYGHPTAPEHLCEPLCTPCTSELCAPKLYASTHGHYLEGTPAQQLSHLQAVYDGAPVALAFLDCDLRYRNLNQRLANLNGVSVEAHLGRLVFEVRPNLFPQLRTYLERALAGEAIHHVRLGVMNVVTGVEQHMLFSFQPTLDEADEVIGVSLAAFDLLQWEEKENQIPELNGLGSTAETTFTFHDDAVTFAGGTLQTGTVTNADLAPAIGN